MGDNIGYNQDQIIKGFKQNDSSILRTIYSNTYPKVRSHILKNNGDEDQAKDIFQEAFVVCWRNIKDSKFSNTGSVEGYLYTIAKNKWTDYLRSATYKKTVVKSKLTNLQIVADNDLADEDVEQENMAVLKQALSKLGEQCKTLLKQFYYERKSMNEISEMLNITPASARNQKYRCMEKLKALSLDLKKHE